MATTQDQLESFNRFVSERLKDDGTEPSLEELFHLWRLENPTSEEQEEIHQAIRNGIAEADAGVGRPLDEFVDHMQKKHNIPPDA